jgi:glycosyltransferase involved in cell wall biosynthesis
MHYAPMMRGLYGIPCLSTNTIHLPAFAQHLLPDALYKFQPLMERWMSLAPPVERTFAKVYNGCDGLIVQCDGLSDYWVNRGIECPVHVIPRPIDVRVFDAPQGRDPVRSDFEKGSRLIIVCRHAREKDIDKVLTLFAKHVLPKRPEASLTLIGDGPDHQNLIDQAHALKISHRCEFVGERPQRDLPNYYRHADMFVYASISETFGQVINEALWCGLPVVGVNDGLGVSYQVDHDESGFLANCGPTVLEEMGAYVVRLIDNTVERQVMSLAASARSRARTHPDVIYAAYENAYKIAQENIRRNPPKVRNIKRPNDLMWLVKDHLTPWVWKHAALSAIGTVRNNNYEPTSEVPFDAAPEQHVLRPSPTPELHGNPHASTPRDWSRAPDASLPLRF